MQNFTFGRKGTNWFLFTFLLLIGTLPSFGQNDCPEVGDFPTSQTFCFTQTVSELDTNGYPVYQTDKNQDDTQALPDDELLVDGVTYYVGGDSGTCTRLPVTVTVNSATRPSNDVTGSITTGFEISSCTPADFDNVALADLFNPISGYTIEVYDSEFGTTPFTGTLQPGGSYFVAQVPNTQDAQNNVCPSKRVAVGFNPNQIGAPDTENAQIFCADATIADLQVEGTYNNTQDIRWYRSQNGNSPLAEDTELINGATYYVGQVVNERGSPMPPCETPAEDRAPVTVSLEDFDAGNDVNETLCQSEIQTRLDAGETPTAIFSSYIEVEEEIAGITFSPSISSLVSDYNSNPFQTFTTNATVTTEAGCEDTVQITLEIVEEFEAGDDNTTTVCRSDLPESPTETQVEGFFRGLLGSDADTNGTFDNESIANITTSFNNGDGTGTYSTTYTVGEGTSCEDTAQLSVTVTGAADAGNDVEGSLCLSEVEEIANDFNPQNPDATLTDLFERFNWTGDLNGTFAPSPTALGLELLAYYNNDDRAPSLTLEGTYTVGEAESECGIDSAEFSITITDDKEAIASANNQTIDVCTSDASFNLFDALSENTTLGGSFTLNGEAFEGSSFDASSLEEGDYNFTYSVNGDELECIEGEAEADFTINVTSDFDLEGSITSTLCRADLNDQYSETVVKNYFLGLLSGEVSRNGSFDDDSIAEMTARYNNGDGLGTYTTTYTVGEGTSCEASVEISVTVQPSGDANAGDIADQVICASEEMINLSQYLQDTDAQEGGVFSGDGVNENGEFDASMETGIYTVTYTVDDSVSCVIEGTSDSTNFDIRIIEGGQAIASANNQTIDVCTSDASFDLFDALSDDTTPGGSFTLNGEAFEGSSFDASSLEEGDYNFTYSVNGDELECIEGEAEADFTLNVVSDFNLEGPITSTLCRADLNDQYSETVVKNYFLGLLSGEVSRNGSFDDDSIAEMTARYNNGDGLGTYTTTYTVGEGTSCEASVEISVTVQPSGDANAGDIADQVICASEEMINLSQYLQDTDAQEGGVFSGDGVNENGEFDASMETGIYTVTYTVDDSVSCVIEGTSDSTNFDIRIIEGGQAIASANNQTIDVCTSDASFNLFDALSDDTTPGGSFTLNGEAFEGSSFDASNLEEGDYNFTYSVNGDELECIEGEAEADFTLNVVSDFNLEGPITSTLCRADLNDQYSETVVKNYFLGLLSGEVSRNGSFDDDSIAEMTARYNNGDGLGTYTTTYTVGEGTSCEASVEISVTVQPSGDANAGDIADQVICASEGMINLNDYLLSTDAQMGGTFSGDGVEDNMFNASMGEGNYTITYTVDDSAPCVTPGTSDSTSFDIEVIEDGEAVAEANNQAINVCTSETTYDLFNALSDNTTPGGSFTLNGEAFEGSSFDASNMEEGNYDFTYSISGEELVCVEGEATADFTINVTSENFDAGDDASVTECAATLDPNPSLETARGYYINLLSSGVPTNGTFEPSIEIIRAAYLENQVGTFTTTYTLGSGSCSDSVELTVNVIDAIDANAGEIEDQTLCSSDADLNLYSLLSDDANTNGTFEGYTNGIFSPSEIGAGTYEVTYSVTEDAPCVTGEASTTFTIDVIQGANAGDDMEVALCDNEEAQDLYNYISADADMDGTFTDLADGIFNPADYDAGSYEFIYTVTSDDDQCGGDDTATITVNLGVAPAAPVAAETRAFCTIDVPTVALLSAEGTNLTWYADAELTTMLSDEDVLESGDYYVTQTSDEGCESNAAMTTVNVVDSPAPTINSDYELCEFDDPTIADLTAEINESGEVTWYAAADATTPLSNNEMLSDGTTYYATLISENGCESSERLAVTVTLEDCELLFPEAITPNGDGRNDTFVVEKIEGEYPNFNITIFNRWGNAVYKGNASTPEWDGTSNQSGNLGDDVLPVGVYFYVVDFNDGSTKPRQGRVYLSR